MSRGGDGYGACVTHLNRPLLQVLGLTSESANLVMDEIERIAAKSDEEMLRVKACEHIAEGEEGWEEFSNVCPSAAAVANLRRNMESLIEAARIGLAACIAWGGKCEARGEMILASESVIQAEKIRSAIARATDGLPDAIDGLNQIGMPEGAKMISALRDFIYTFLPLYEATLKEKQDLRDKVIAEEHRTKQAAAAASSSR